MSQWIPNLIHPDRDCRNGHVPSAHFYGEAVAAENYLTGYGDRMVFCERWPLGQTGVFPDAATTIRRFRFRSRYGAAFLRAVIVVGPSYNYVGDVSPPTGAGGVYINVTLSGGATSVLGPVTTAAAPDASAPTDIPSTWRVGVETVAITANSIYECAIVAEHYGRPISITVFELGQPTVSESTDYYNAMTANAGAPILDTTRSRLLVGLSNMYRRNGGTICHWGQMTARTRTSATAINLMDNATTGAPTAATPGWYLDMSYRNTQSRPSSVPFELAVYGSVAGGSGGTVTLVNSSGTALATVTVTGAAGWYTATGTISTTAGKFDPQFAGDGTNQLSVYAVSFLEWES